MGIFWRSFIKVFAFLTAVTVFFLLFTVLLNFLLQDNEKEIFLQTSGDIKSPNKIAILKLNGPILDEPPIYLDLGLLNSLNVIYTSEVKKTLNNLENEKIKGLIISINSPGGSVMASSNLYNILSNFSKKNSIDIFFHANGLMASGAYWAALSGKKIYANYGSLIGSIGVKGPDWMYFDLPISISNGIFGNSIETKKGIKQFNNIAGNSKDLFNSFRAPTKKEITELQNNTKNIYLDFVKLVSKNRSIETNIVINEIGAMIYESKNAKNNYLIDDILDLNDVIQSMVNYLSIKNYQIIEKRKSKDVLIYNFFNNNFKSKNNFESFEKKISNNICNISKYELSVIFLNSKINSSC